ncbi:MAG TPA: M4 family metallopeptidase, partial [Thermoanaerobaculia bacterium]
NQWSPPDAVSASFNFGKVFDYYKQTHGRNSIDGEGGNILAIVRLGQNFYNAFWTDTIGGMFFGDADTFAGSLDVVGHEMTHGVTSHTAGLVYQDQAGALNEAMSDVFGEMVENFLLGSNDWAIGTDISQPIRDMSDPGRFNDPAKMSEYVQTDSDHGGVHTNSGIINHAYYLLAEGEDGAIGKHDAERIFYRMLTMHLSQNSQFLDARLGAIQSADEIFGAGSNQSVRTAQAFDEVEILDAAPAPPPPDVPPVAGGDSAVLIYRDGSLYLGRRETALGDPSQGVNLSARASAFERPAVSGDGTLAFFVTEDNDACFLPTDGSEAESCLELPGQIASVAMSRDANVYAFVLLTNGERDNRIAVIDLKADSAVTYDLVTPATDGGYANTVLFADTLEFTANQRYLFYDALSELTLSDGSTAGAWSVSAIDFSGGQTYTLVPPVAGADIANPAVGKTSDDFYTFEVDDQDAGTADIYTARLSTGEFVQAVVGVGASGPAPSYTGDDRALVYAYPDDSAPTGSSLATIALGPDRLHAAGSPPAPYLFDGAYGVIYRRGGYTPPQGNCAPDATTLCLSNGRYQVQATFTTSGGNQGIAQAQPLTADTGYFTFFNPNNVEVVVKVLNACPVNHHNWVFAGGLTDVATVLTVTDTVTGVTRTYANPQHTPFQPIQDTQAFSTCFAGISADEEPASEAVKAAWDAVQYALDHAGEAAGGGAPPASSGGPEETESVPEPVLAPRAADACIPEDTTLCLTGGRFRVQVTYRTSDGRTGSGHAVALTSDTGYFWFLTASNVELVVKVLNACSISQHYWTFGGGLTNVEVTTTVRDTQTGTEKTYHNALGTKFQPIQDTGAFPTCP